ncbi:Hypothetical protein FKW44_024119 [Caligus rogercresseyi]|uniref:Uncharacterized protein n=1 Tax=Caligus rogercresseyi TaxID=217165 RepID=A0A7T8GMF4_CALRO|nr:Hypothetical protein FKW44_024119 [Caligus rogercresseyi]
MSLCCEIGCRERLPLGISVEGNPSPVPLRRPSRENPPQKLIRTLTAEVCTL